MMEKKEQEVLAQRAKGMRDIGDVKAKKRLYIKDTLSKIFRKYGFSHLETPALERSGNLVGSYGEEGEKLIYHVLNSGDYLGKVRQEHGEEKLGEVDSKDLRSHISDKALRYDLTLPLARYVAENLDEALPLYKRYQIGSVWRADRPQKGRYREFTQCDVDIIGSNYHQCEVELILLIDEVFKALGLDDYKLSINNRRLCNLLAKEMGAENEKDVAILLNILDQGSCSKELTNKLTEECRRKISISDWRNVCDAALERTIGTSLLQRVKDAKNSGIPFSYIYEDFCDGDVSLDAKAEIFPLYALKNCIEDVGRGDVLKHLVFDVNLIRGMNYYTGIIFEATATAEEGQKSILGGGRYNNLISRFSKKKVPAVGVSFGMDRIEDILDTRSAVNTPFKVLVINDSNYQSKGIKNTQQLRDVGIESTLYFGNKTTVGAQLSYATARGFSHILIPDKDRNMVRLRSAVSISKDKNGKPIYEEYKFPISEAGSRCKEIFLLHITTQ